MPFTGSHPAAVLPFFRTGLVPSALVIGSMAPDLPYYLQLGHDSTHTHTVVGVLTIDLLMGLIGYAIWTALLAPAAVALSPLGLRRRLAAAAHADTPPSHAGGRNRTVVPDAFGTRDHGPVTVVASLVVGGLTHVAWDAFTHAHRWGTTHVAWLEAQHGPLAGYRWAQYASGIVGAAILVVAALRWWRTVGLAAEPLPGAAARTASALRLLLLTTSAAAGVTAFFTTLASESLRPALFAGATWGGTAGLATALAVAATRRRWSPT